MRPMLTISAVVLLHLGVIAVLVGVNGCRTTTGFEKAGDLSAYNGTPVSPGAAATPSAADLNEGQPTRAPQAPVAAKAGPGGTHVVAKGESLWLVARREGVTVRQLAGANGLEVNAVLREGQKLTIPTGDFVAPAPKIAAPAAGGAVAPAAPAAPGTSAPAAPRSAYGAPEGGFGGFGVSAPTAPAAPAPAPRPETPAPAEPAPAAPEGGFGGFGTR